MKLRLGFVSNSSTSSFCILGIVVDENIQKKMEKIAKKKECDDSADLFTVAEFCDLEYYNEEQTDGDDVVGIAIDDFTVAEIVMAEARLKKMFGSKLNYKIFTGSFWC